MRARDVCEVDFVFISRCEVVVLFFCTAFCGRHAFTKSAKQMSSFFEKGYGWGQPPLHQFEINLFESLRLRVEVEIFANDLSAAARDSREKTRIVGCVEQRPR